MASDSSVFTWKAEYQKVVAWTGAGPAIASLVASAVVLVLALLIYLDHATRRSLQRQSLQMLLWVQAASIVYNGSYLAEMLITGPTKGCNVAIILTLFASNFINFVIMLIPINLQLALVHGIRTEGWVRWYLLGAFVCAAATAIPGIIEDVWGWDPLTRICWISITDPTARNAWQIGAFYAWIVIAMVISAISTLIVIFHLLIFARIRDRSATSTVKSGSSTGAIIRSVAWRITLYPVILILNNSVSAAANFGITLRGGIHSWETYVVWCTSGFFYGIMPMAYALVALFIDPSFSHAVRDYISGQTSSGTWEKSASGVEMGTRQRYGKMTTLRIEFSRHVVTDIGDGMEIDTPATFGDSQAVSTKPLNLSPADIEQQTQISTHQSETVDFGDEDADIGKAMSIINAADDHDDQERAGDTARIQAAIGRTSTGEALRRSAREVKRKLRAELNQL